MTRAEVEQRARIDSARAVTGARPVIAGKVPRWFWKAFNAFRDEHDCGSWSWFDHVGASRTHGGVPIVSCEPYQVDEEEIREVFKFAELSGMTAKFSSDSWWFPGRTLRIDFERKERR